MSKKSSLFSSLIISLVSIIISIVAIFAAYHIFFLDQPKREITVNLNPPIPLINIQESSKHEFKIFYQDKFLETINVYILNGEIINSGNQPIEKDDYVKPIKFIFNQDDKLISVSSRSEPSDIEMILTKLSDNEVSTNKVLLNPQDKVYTSFLIQSSDYALITKKLNIRTRIKGISEIKKNIESSEINWVFIILFIIIVTALISKSVEELIRDYGVAITETFRIFHELLKNN